MTNINWLLGSWTKINIWNWVLKVIFCFSLFRQDAQWAPWQIFVVSPHRYTFFLFLLKRIGSGADTMLVFFSIYFTHLKLPVLKFILHSRNGIFRLCKPLKATYTFTYKIKPTKLKNKPWNIWLSILQCGVGLA